MNKWIDSEERAEALVLQYQAMLHHVLRRFGLGLYDLDYPDLIQEGRVLILACQQELEIDGLDPSNHYAFAGYLKQKFTWYCLRYFSKRNMHKGMEVAWSQDWDPAGPEWQEPWQLVFRDFLATLSPRQVRTLTMLIEYSSSIKDLAQLEGRSKSKYYRDLEAIRKKYQKWQDQG